MRKPLTDRFWERVKKTNSCWLWTGSYVRDGYGSFHLDDGKAARAHRLSYEFEHGAIPKGMYVLHRCDVPACVNPKHLFLGDQFANMRDMVAKGRNSCIVGEKNPRAKLTWADVRKIRSLVSHDPHNRGVTHADISLFYRVSQSTIAQISRGVIWREAANV